MRLLRHGGLPPRRRNAVAEAFGEGRPKAKAAPRPPRRPPLRPGSRDWLAILLLLPCLAWASERPNVLLIVADDLGWADVGFHGGPIDTPSLDRLAAEGVELRRFYATPICSPSRAALMTGRDPMRLGVAYATIMPWSNVGVHPDEKFMPQAFREAGYQTAIIGKWHLGHAQQTYHPNARGFDHFYGHLHTEVGYFPPFASQGGKDFQRNGRSVDEDGYETYLLADEAVRWIQGRDAGRPFFLYLPLLAPHTPLQAPEDLIEKYRGLDNDREKSRSRSDGTHLMAALTFQDSARGLYAAVVEAADQAIGRVLAALDAAGLADNTIVWFLSDNGGATYATGGAYNYPLRGGKGDAFEGGIRVPSVVRWPGRLAPGRQAGSILTVMDLYPTLAAMAGVPITGGFPLDGRDLSKVVAGEADQELDDFVFFAAETPIRGSFSLTAFDDDWKLVQEIEQGLLAAEVTNYLFRIAEDPYERNNLAAEHPARVADLGEAIRRWRLLHPLNGTRSNLVPPPGWRAPKDWAAYPIPIDALQEAEAPGMPPPAARLPLDLMHGESGRLIYNCTPRPWLFGACLAND